jgi:hypothetical protein
MLRKVFLSIVGGAALFGGIVSSPARAADQSDVVITVWQEGPKVVKKAISAWHSWNDSHPCVQVEADGKTFYVPLVPSKESRGTINFSQDPFRASDNKHDNGIIRVEYVNFGRFTDSAAFQTKVDKHHAEDRDRGAILHNGGETEIGIGASIRGFYFAIRGTNTEQILAENPNAYIKVTILRHPAH